MKQVFDTNEILYKLLNVDAVNSVISGRVYNGQRPLNSELEDVVVNTIVLSQEYLPQIGTSNVNIHVKDLSVNVSGAKQIMADNSRMKEISEVVLSLIRNAILPGLAISVENQTVIEESEIKQHYVNIRINWNIQQ